MTESNQWPNHKKPLSLNSRTQNKPCESNNLGSAKSSLQIFWFISVCLTIFISSQHQSVSGAFNEADDKAFRYRDPFNARHSAANPMITILSLSA